MASSVDLIEFDPNAVVIAIKRRFDVLIPEEPLKPGSDTRA